MPPARGSAYRALRTETATASGVAGRGITRGRLCRGSFTTSSEKVLASSSRRAANPISNDKTRFWRAYPGNLSRVPKHWSLHNQTMRFIHTADWQIGMAAVHAGEQRQWCAKPGSIPPGAYSIWPGNTQRTSSSSPATRSNRTEFRATSLAGLRTSSAARSARCTRSLGTTIRFRPGRCGTTTPGRTKGARIGVLRVIFRSYASRGPASHLGAHDGQRLSQRL